MQRRCQPRIDTEQRTPVGLNALLTRTGAVVGLLCTEGFRDILEIRRGDRGDPYDLFWTPAPALVPRRLRIPVRGRMLATGVEHAPLASEDIAAAVATFADGGVTSVAGAFINPYSHPAH